MRMCACDDVCVCICTCVCVESPESKGISRGPGTHDCLSWPTKTGQHGGENVPANF